MLYLLMGLHGLYAVLPLGGGLHLRAEMTCPAENTLGSCVTCVGALQAVVPGLVGGAVQVRRAAEAGGRRVPHRGQHGRPVERPHRRAGGRPHLQGARPHVLRWLNNASIYATYSKLQ